MSNFVPLADTAMVIRVGPENGPHLPGKVDDPLPEHFEFSPGDRRESPPLLSVFQEGETRVEEAKEIVGGVNCSAFILDVGDIRAVNYEGHGDLDVFKSPIIPAKAHMDGAEGHCSISGLHLPAGDGKTAKRIRRRLREGLARISRRAE